MLTITSSAFAHNALIPPQYTCDGADIIPPLSFADIPADARSLVLIMDDPDAPRGIWDHWVVFNIPPQTAGVEEGRAPHGTAGIGTSGQSTYMGPCPGVGEHHYVFTLYALDTDLSLPAGVTKNEVLAALHGHVLEQATLIGRFARKR